jgi:hypothetical protein
MRTVFENAVSRSKGMLARLRPFVAGLWTRFAKICIGSTIFTFLCLIGLVNDAAMVSFQPIQTTGYPA